MENCEHEMKKFAGGFYQCRKCKYKLVEYSKSINLIQKIHGLEKELKMMKSCQKMLKVSMGDNKIANMYIEKELVFTIIKSSEIDEIKAKLIYQQLGIKYENEL